MSLPNFQCFMLPLLKLVEEGAEYSLISLREVLPGFMSLSPEELAERLPSGGSKFADRTQWAIVYLAKAGLVTRTRRGHIALSERGKSVLAQNPAQISVQDLDQFEEFRSFRGRELNKTEDEAATLSTTPQEIESEETPEEALDRSYHRMRKALGGELLETVKKGSPRFFEWLVLQLLLAMGYGGPESGQLVGRSGDEGIDGVIHQDKLGLETVYIQAKKWADTVGRPVVQAFAGSLQGHRARKGVFITTSRFSQEARDYVRRIDTKIVLIDGTRLSELMMDHNVGVSIAKDYLVKKIDLDFFEA